MIRLTALTPAQLDFSPAPTAWSLTQIVEHLLLVEQALLQGAKKKLLQPARNVTLRERSMAVVVTLVMKSRLKVKTPPGASHVIPAAGRAFDSMRSGWSVTRDDFERFLEELPADRCQSALFRHPVSGGMNASQALTFIHAHIQHHERQIEKLVRSATAAPEAVRAS